MDQISKLSLKIKIIQIKASVITNINLALQQNAFPVITDIEIENSSEKDLSNIELSVTSSPDFLIDRIWPIQKIRTDETLIVEDCHVELKADFLRAIKESLKGELLFVLKDGDKILDEVKIPVQLLSKDAWGGINVLPEIVAAYIQPNDAAVQGVLRNASKKLEASGHSGALDGYQSKSPKRIALLASAHP